MNVYIVTSGNYSDYHIVAAYSTEERALAHAKLVDDGGVEVCEIDRFNEIPLGLEPWKISMDREGRIWYARRTDLSNKSEFNGQITHNGYFQIAVWAKDKEHAIKIVNEKRIRRIAEGEWVELK